MSNTSVEENVKQDLDHLYSVKCISLNRAAELAGVSPEEFKDLFEDAGVPRALGFLSEERYEIELSGF